MDGEHQRRARSRTAAACRTATTPAPIPTATAGVSSNPGSWAAIRPAAAPRNIAGKVGPPRKLAERDRVGEPLEGDQERQRAERPGAAPRRRARERVLAREQDLVRCPFRWSAWKAIARPATATPISRQSDEGARRARRAGSARRDAEDHEGDHGDARPPAGSSRRSRPTSGRANGGSGRTPIAICAGVEPGPRAQPDRDQGPDPGGEQARDQHQLAASARRYPPPRSGARPRSAASRTGTRPPRRFPRRRAAAPISGGASPRIRLDRRGARARRPGRSAAPPARARCPSPIDASAASMTPGSSIGWVGAALSPLAGT